MVFSSNVFLFLFLPAFLLAYYLTPGRWRSWTILLGSYLFYAWWRPDFLLLFLLVTCWNHWFALRIRLLLDVPDKRRAFRWLILGVLGNLATLGYFKYANFGVEVFAALLQPLGINTWTLEQIILPLGISFYIFQAISYLVDIYRNEARPTRNFVDFAAYIALFPQLIAGPIIRYKLIDWQFRERSHSLALFSLGASRFMLGFVKKVLIADSMAPMNQLFLGEGSLQLVDAWFGLLVSIIQLYFDFSGYSDMAIGLGLMMGFRFPENFNQPHLAQSLTEFWQRWHITLANFLLAYVYKPLTRSWRLAPLVALLLTMLLSGLWHGASFAYLLWGLFFGVGMVIERLLKVGTTVHTPYRLGRNLRTFLLLNLSMPLFYTGDLGHSLQIYASLLGLKGIGNLDNYIYGTSMMNMGFVLVALVWMLIAGRINLRYTASYKTQPDTPYFMRHVGIASSLLLWTGFLLAWTQLIASAFSPFLYFQF